MLTPAQAMERLRISGPFEESGVHYSWEAETDSPFCWVMDGETKLIFFPTGELGDPLEGQKWE